MIKGFKKNKKILAFEQNYNLLSDVPLPADKEQDIKFGHPEIAKVVADLVLKANPPFTIGLFGKWGTGKTTIINLVKDYVKKQNIKTVIFDVWKYAGDSLRRQFLIQIDQDLGLGLQYKDKLNQSLTIQDPTAGKIKLDWSLLFNKIGIFLLIIALLGLLALIFNLLQVHQDWLSLFGSVLVSLGLAGAIFQAAVNTIVRVQTIMTTFRTDSAEGFEDRFYNEVLSHSKIRGQKLLIVVDNLDRTAYDKATDLLSDIKTFLSREEDDNKVIFLIACDEKAIKKHLERSNFDDPAEFLRKFFNTSIRIPRFLGLDLDEYTRDLLKETKIDDFINNNLEWLVTYTFRDNPREIKQFVNTLISHYLLARQMEETKQIVTEGAITKKIDALAKFLIINQKFPYASRCIEEMALSEVIEWNEIENEIKSNSDSIYGKIINHLGDKEKNIIMREKGRFEEFIENTDPIDIPNISILVSFKQSEQERRLVGVDRFLVVAEDKKIEDARKIFKKFPSDKINYLDDILKSRIQKIRKGGAEKKAKIWSMGASIIEIADENLKKLDKFLNELILNFPEEDDLLRYIEDYSPIKIFDKLFPLIQNKNYQKEKVIRAYLSLFRLSSGKDPNTSLIPEKYVLELMNVIVKHKNDFIQHKKTIRETIKNYFYTEQFLSIFINNALEEEFITDETKEKFLDSIKNEDLNNIDAISKKLELLSKLSFE